MANKLIFGKDQTQGIVSLEISDNQAELFIQQEDGSIKSEFVSNKYWMLSANPIFASNSNIRMKGHLHYKFGTQFNTRDEFIKARAMYRQDDTYSIYDPKEAFMVNRGITYHKGLKHKDVSILSFDIETTGLNGQTDDLLLISSAYRNSAGAVEKKIWAYDEHESQGQMLEAWTSWVREKNPSVICGHNIYGFDIPFLQHIADRENVQLALGRNGSPLHINTKFASEFRKDGSQTISYHKVRCYGRELIDTMFLAIKYDIVAKKYESYGLKKIIEAEGIRFEGRVLYDASQIRFRFKDPTEWDLIKRYCIDDSLEALALYDLMAPSVFYWAQTVPKSFQSILESATGSQLNSVIVRSYLQEGHSIPKTSPAVEYEGAISFGKPGIYRNCWKQDVNSLYPSIILQHSVFSKDKDPEGNFLKLMEYLTVQRLENKKIAAETGDQYYKDLEQSQKIGANSGYGFLGAPGLNFNSPKHAAFITEKGREILITAIEWATGQKYETWKKNSNL